MAQDDDSFELAAGVIQAGIETAEAVSEGLSVPGVDLALTLVRRAFEAQQRAKAKEFFTRLAVATGSNDPDALAIEIAKSIEQPWAQEAVERGFRLMMSTVDDAARPCIAVLVAEYLIEKKHSPDRVFQRVGALLADSVRRDLTLLRNFCECVREVSALGAVGSRAFLLRGTQITLAGLVDKEKKPFRSKSFTGFDNGEGAMSLLIRHGFGKVPAAVDPGDSTSVSLLEFSARYDHAYLVLGRCLRALADAADQRTEARFSPGFDQCRQASRARQLLRLARS